MTDWTKESPFRTFIIDGKETTDTTHRTRIVESITPIAGRSFLDVGSCDGYEARALAIRGASRSVAIEGKQIRHDQAAAAAEQIGLKNHQAILGDIRRIEQYGLGIFDCVCCFGLLYHMNNPFNVLKHIAHVTGDLLILETHIAPEPWTENELLPKHRSALLRGTRTLYLDGARFEGRVCIHRGSYDLTQGSLDESWTFWLTPSSLAKALTRAGFSIIQWHNTLDSLTPEAVARNGHDLRIGYENTKILVVAKIDRARLPAITEGTISSRPDSLEPPEVRESLIEIMLSQLERLKRRVRF